MRGAFPSLVILGVLTLVVSAADAGSVSIWVNDGVGGWAEAALDPTGVDALIGAYTTPDGNFTIVTDNASNTNGPSADLTSTAMQIRHNGSGVDTVQIAVIGTDYSSPTLAPISVNSVVGGGNGANSPGLLASLTFESYVDPTDNGLPGSLAGGQGLQTPAILFPVVGGPGASQGTTISSDLSSLYSVAELSTISMNGMGTISGLGGDTTLNGAVPEPAMAAVLGLGGLMAVGRRRGFNGRHRF